MESKTDAELLQQIYDNASHVDEDYRNRLEDYFNNSKGTSVWKLQNFPKYVPRQSLTRFLTRYEIFKKIINIQGSIVELGVLGGGSLLSWAQLSAIYEHLNYQRKIIGFDMFGDNPEVGENDLSGDSINIYTDNAMALDSFDDIKKSIKLYDKNRFCGSQEKVFLVKGDATVKVPEYLKKYPETLVSLLYLDINLYEPTKVALDHFYPRMPRGSIIVFDEINDRGLPGETLAVLDTVGINRLKIERFSYDTKICYAILD